MPVVINEFEVAPPPPKGEAAGKQAAQNTGPTLTPALMQEIERAIYKKQERIHRLTAY